MVKDVFEKVAPQYDVMNDFMSFFMHRLWKDRYGIEASLSIYLSISLDLLTNLILIPLLVL